MFTSLGCECGFVAATVKSGRDDVAVTGNNVII